MSFEKNIMAQVINNFIVYPVHGVAGKVHEQAFEKKDRYKHEYKGDNKMAVAVDKNFINGVLEHVGWQRRNDSKKRSTHKREG